VNFHALDAVDMRRMSPAAEAFALKKLARDRYLDGLLAQAATARAEFVATEPRTADVQARIRTALAGVR
jgi:hypothetical protein